MRSAPTAALLAAVAVAACNRKPAHYYVLCEDRDYNDWRLVNAERDANGYILACTYQSPDQRQVYTARCRKSGCD